MFGLGGVILINKGKRDISSNKLVLIEKWWGKGSKGGKGGG